MIDASLFGVRVLIITGWSEQQALAQVHETHEHTGDDDDDQCGREDQRRAERIVSRLQPDTKTLARA